MGVALASKKKIFSLTPVHLTVSRAAADMSLKTFSETYNFPVVTTRAANVYGPGQQLYRIIPRTILFILLGRKLQLHGGGTSTRSFIHIGDVSDATWRIMEGAKWRYLPHLDKLRDINSRFGISYMHPFECPI